MPFAHVNDATLYYELHGPEGGPPLVLLHAATATFHSSWRKQLGPLSEHFRLLGVDMRGHGQSNNPADRLDLRQMADDVRDLLDHLGWGRVHLLGYSGGGSAALFFAARHTSRLHTLMMVSNNMELDTARASMNFWDYERVQREEPKWLEALIGLHNAAPADLLRWWAQEDVIRPDWRTEELAHITVPALVVGGDRDPIIPLEQTLKLYEALPNAELCVMPGVGHGIPARRPELFNVLIIQFLRQHIAERST